MNPHLGDLLAAYHDGELPLGRRQQVERHLQDCPTCRLELEALERLSSLLQADPVPAHTPPEQFAAQVQLRLPRASLPASRQNATRPPRWVLGIPLMLIGVWAFLQAALWITSGILVADQVLGPRAAFFNGWVASTGLLETGVSLVLFNVVLLIGTAVLLSAWMAFWLAWEKDKNESSLKGGVI